jgi:hypothetical protein
MWDKPEWYIGPLCSYDTHINHMYHIYNMRYFSWVKV